MDSRSSLSNFDRIFIRVKSLGFVAAYDGWCILRKEDAITHRQILPNGLTVIAEHSDSDYVSFELRVPCGSSGDHLPGEAYVLEHWLYKGAGGLDARTWTQQLDDLGAQRSGGTGLEYTRFGLTLLPEDVSAGLAAYADLILRPGLDTDDFSATVDLVYQDLMAIEDSPVDVLFGELRKKMFLSGHRYPVQGQQEALSRLTPEHVRQVHKRYTPQGSVLSCVGRLDERETVATVEALLGSWQGSPAQRVWVESAEPFVAHLDREGRQTHVVLEYVGEHPSSPNWYTFNLISTALCGGFGSRLFQEVREKRGLVYQISASPERVGDLGFLTVYAATSGEQMPEVLEVIQSEMDRLSFGITEEELNRAKLGLLSSAVQNNETAQARCSMLGSDHVLLGRCRTLDEIETQIASIGIDEVCGYLAQTAYKPIYRLSLGKPFSGSFA